MHGGLRCEGEDSLLVGSDDTEDGGGDYGEREALGGRKVFGGDGTGRR